jgi:hypothetical protein
MNFAAAEIVNVNALILYLAFPVIFLTVASVVPGKVTLLKAVCISLAYLSLVLLNGLIGDANPALATGNGALDGKDTSPFGLIFIGVSLWAFALVCHSEKSGKEDHPQ